MRRIQVKARLDCRFLQLGIKSFQILSRVALNLVDKRRRGGLRGLGEQTAHSIERVADHFGHLRLRVADEIAAGLIHLAAEFVGHLGSLFAQFGSGLLANFVRQALNLGHGLLFIPLSGLNQIFNRLVFHLSNPCLEFGQTSRSHGISGLPQRFLDSAQIPTELRQRFGECFIRRRSNALLMHRNRRIEQRTATRETLHRLVGPLDLRLHQRFHLPAELRHRFLARLFECSANARGDFLADRFRPAMQLVAVQIQNVVHLRLKAAQRMLLYGFQPRREILQSAGGFVRPRQGGFHLCSVRIQGVA